MGRICPVNILVAPRPTVAGGTGLFTTTFPATQSPISAATYILGGTDGVDWQDINSTGGSPGFAFGVGSSPGPPYNDCIATVRNGYFNPLKHSSRIVVRKVGGYTPPSTQEVEALSMDITSGNVAGYEVTQGFGLTSVIARWNGPVNSFDTDVFTELSGAPFGVADGDFVEVLFDYTSGSPVISLYKNQTSSPDYVVTDTSGGKIVGGHPRPGFGFFARAGTGLDMTKYCISGFTGATR